MILEVVHNSANDLYEAGIIDAVTMREYDALCLPAVPKIKPREIKKLRLREKVSQAIFAIYLNVSPHTVRHWERGEKHPNGSSLRLLDLVNRKGLSVLM